MQLRQAYLKLKSEGRAKLYALQPGRVNSFDEIHISFEAEPVAGGTRYALFLHPKTDVELLKLEVEFAFQPDSDARFFANGFQSWSESRLLPLDGQIPGLRSIARKYLGFSGDDHISGIPRGTGNLHSWTYTYFQQKNERALFWGSLAEHTGFTLFLWNADQQLLTVRKDVEGLHLQHSFPALDFWVGAGAESEVFERYFELLALHQPGFRTPQQVLEPALGWTSWYRYFNRISAEIILKNAEAIASSGLPFREFQLDDGWQTAVGDWRSVRPEFPEGMGALAKNIKALGLRPGLWLAPFVAAANSRLVREHPNWLLKNQRGNPLRAGWNPLWGGWYYALDFYHPGVQDYLSGVFHIVFDHWGYELVKLDFLFAVCLAPPPGKTRGQVMREAMEFLRLQTGSRTLLACGVPLGAAFGVADICRIGGDVHLRWEHRLLAGLRHRERVSTLASLRATLGRWHLNRRAFLNDPDVFILRSEHQHLTPMQQHTLLTVNRLLGGAWFTSDQVSEYSPEQRSELEETLEWGGAAVSSVAEIAPDVFCICFDYSGKAWAAWVNLNARQVEVENKNGRIGIQPFETIMLNS